MLMVGGGSMCSFNKNIVDLGKIDRIFEDLRPFFMSTGGRIGNRCEYGQGAILKLPPPPPSLRLKQQPGCSLNFNYSKKFRKQGSRNRYCYEGG